MVIGSLNQFSNPVEKSGEPGKKEIGKLQILIRFRHVELITLLHFSAQ
jgi:hypothetical protein